jgi:hypothetical protein
MCLPMRAHNIRNLDSSLGARQHVRGALTTLFKLKRVVQREEKGQSGLIKGFYPQQTSLAAQRSRTNSHLCSGPMTSYCRVLTWLQEKQAGTATLDLNRLTYSEIAFLHPMRT